MFKGLFICGVLRFVAGWRTFVLFSYICLYCSVLLEFFTSQISVLPTFLFLLILHFMSKISVYVFFTWCIMVYKRVPTFVLFSYILVSLRFVGIFSFSNFCCTHLFISLDIVFHEQDLCSCVLHVVYHGVQEMSS